MGSILHGPFREVVSLGSKNVLTMDPNKAIDTGNGRYVEVVG